jgi:cytochrome b6-f complex iron-sulfur subunit
LGGCVSARYVSYSQSGNNLVINKQELAEDKFVLVSTDRLEAPIYLLKEENDNYLAIYLLCTHKFCDVKPAGTILACPCHGSEYTQYGKVIKGPAEKDLATFPVTSDEENIYIKFQS